jgi:3-dehydrosphinganine reductase
VRPLWLITGAASGLGRELAAQLARRGERMVLWDRDRERLERTVSLLGPSVVHAEVVDVVNADATRQSAERSIDAAGQFHRAIHCASILRVGPSLTMSATDYRALIEVNYLGSVHVARALIPSLLDAGRRSGPSELVLVASIAGLRGVSSLAGYSASKHAVLGFAEALREELHGQPLRIRVACPPPLDVPMLSNLPEVPPLYRLSGPRPVDDVATELLAALDQSAKIILLSRVDRLMWLTQRLAPRALDFALRRFQTR